MNKSPIMLAVVAVAAMGLADSASAQARFKLRTLDGEQNGRCLEANEPTSRHVGGNAFMETCAPTTGQAWTAVFIQPGVFWLQAASNPNLCLEANSPTSPVMNGGAFMAQCERVTGQLWREVQHPTGRYQLTPQSSPGMCLEGNTVSRRAAAGGAALLQPCAATTGQLWAAHAF